MTRDLGHSGSRSKAQYVLIGWHVLSMSIASLRALANIQGQCELPHKDTAGTDPSESFVLSGGEDRYLRLWDIRSGKLLFEDKFSEEVISVLCSEAADASRVGTRGDAWGSWLGSRKGLFYLQF
ncbi:hypothetical protein MLD38_014611 [Melastoma candidum]|uniref:Uncharacterized protein n=1 Tax=Melastoma candidum TaxID=119954 RepID=A0ACB9RDH0_9MYRT|nr:hypothetical protein MLD38_014611 [Melastoma candidum]